MVDAAKTMRLRFGVRYGCLCILLINTVAAWTLLGILDVDRMEGEGFYVFFQKRIPTFRIKFRNPYLSDPDGEESAYRQRMDANGDWLLNTPEFEDYAAYCKTRFKILSITNPVDRKECRLQDKLHWKTDARY